MSLCVLPDRGFDSLGGLISLFLGGLSLFLSSFCILVPSLFLEFFGDFFLFFLPGIHKKVSSCKLHGSSV